MCFHITRLHRFDIMEIYGIVCLWLLRPDFPFAIFTVLTRVCLRRAFRLFDESQFDGISKAIAFNVKTNGWRCVNSSGNVSSVNVTVTTELVTIFHSNSRKHNRRLPPPALIRVHPHWTKIFSSRAPNCCKCDLDHSISRNWMNSQFSQKQACLLRLNNHFTHISIIQMLIRQLWKLKEHFGHDRTGSSSLSRRDVLLRMFLVQFART